MSLTTYILLEYAIGVGTRVVDVTDATSMECICMTYCKHDQIRPFALASAMPSIFMIV